MTIELPINDAAPAAHKGVDRRTLLKAGAWAAPVLVLTTAVPAATASPFTLGVSNFRAVQGRGANYTYYVDVTNDSLTTSATVSVQFFNGSTPSGTAKGTGSASVDANGTARVSARVNNPNGQPLPTNVSVSVTATGFAPVTGTFAWKLVTTP